MVAEGVQHLTPSGDVSIFRFCLCLRFCVGGARGAAGHLSSPFLFFVFTKFLPQL